MRNFRIKSTRKTIHISYFGRMHTILITIPIVHQTFPSIQRLPTRHISNLYFTLILAVWGSTGAEPAWVSKIENTYYSHRVYMQGHNSVFQTPVINSWSYLMRKSVQVSGGFNILPNRFWKRKPSKKSWFKNWKWFWNQFNSRNKG